MHRPIASQPPQRQQIARFVPASLVDQLNARRQKGRGKTGWNRYYGANVTLVLRPQINGVIHCYATRGH